MTVPVDMTSARFALCLLMAGVRRVLPQREKTLSLIISLFLVACFGMQVDAGPLKDRTRFNIQGDGFWMKGRCFTPGAITIPDEYNFVILSRLDDYGCLVKNRRGERKVRKRKARVRIQLNWVIETDTAPGLQVHAFEPRVCNHARRCRVSMEEPLPTGTPLPRPWRVVGLIGDICGQRRERRTFRNPRLSAGGPRIDWCLNWGTNCGEPAADEFCRRQGFARAIDRRKDPDVDTVTLVMGDGRTCDGRERHCDSFSRIRCERHRDATSFSVHVGRTPAGSGVHDRTTGLPGCH